jgi:hypothetical protein
VAFPVLDTTHAQEQLSLLTDHYKGQPVVQGILNAVAPEIQAIETMFWQIINDFLLVNVPTGDQLNAIGSIVGAQRGFLNDAQYYQLILIQIAVNASQGLCNDIIKIATIAEQHYGPLPQYLDVNQRGFIIECTNLPYPEVIWPELSAARSIATYGSFHYTTWPDGNDFVFTSSYDAAVGEGGFGSVYSSTTGGLMSAAEAI